MWVMVIGLFGPSIPAIIMDLDINYTKAGLFFTALSLGSLMGTPLGGYASDYINRKILYSGIAVVLSAGLVFAGLSAAYLPLLLSIFVLSVAGSPAGTVGQSIMLDMFPEKREHYLSYQSFFASLGSFCAPLLVTLNLSSELSWRWTFFETACMVILLLPFALIARLPPSRAGRQERPKLKSVLSNRRVQLAALFIFLYISLDVGFSYWLAEYFVSELHTSIRISCAGVSIFLLGMMAGRLVTPRLLREVNSRKILLSGLVFAIASLLLFLFARPVPVKAAMVFFYGLGLAPVFPLLMARGTAVYPDQPGTVSGILFACVSFGGMVFPLLFGSIAERIGIRRTYFLVGLIALGLLIALTFWTSRRAGDSKK
jgi:FHS family glucose/mannose:H+ symporter-like MFS transporter